MKARDSRFELLRIIAILFIIVAHYSDYSSWNVDVTKGIAGITTLAYTPFGQIGVKIFAMITGYFMGTKVLSAKDSFKRVRKIWIQVFFYSIIMLLITSLFVNVSIKLISLSIFPITLNEYWFVTAYVLLLLFIPFLNILTTKIDKRTFVSLIVICILCSDILPVLNNTIGGDVSSVMTLITAYLIGSYIRIYDIDLNAGLIIIGIIGGFLLIYISYIALFLLNLNYNQLAHFASGIIPLVIAICAFLLIKKSKPYANKYINLLASTTFSAYLISEHPAFRMYLWHKILNFSKYQYNPLLILAFGLISGIFILLFAMVVDLLRQLLFNFISKQYKRYGKFYN